MKVEFLQQNITSLLSQRDSLFIFAGILSLSNVLLAIAVLDKKEKTILVPLQMNELCWVQGEEVSKEYLEAVGRDMAMLLLDISPASFPYKHQSILKHVAPEAYGALKMQLMRDGEQYTSLQLSTSFKPSQITAHPKTKEVEVKGILTSYIVDKSLRSTPETILLKFTHRGGSLLLERVSGGNPHAS